MPSNDEQTRRALALALRHAAQAVSLYSPYGPLIRIAAGFIDPDTERPESYLDAFGVWQETHGQRGGG